MMVLVTLLLRILLWIMVLWLVVLVTLPLTIFQAISSLSSRHLKLDLDTNFLSHCSSDFHFFKIGNPILEKSQVPRSSGCPVRVYTKPGSPSQPGFLPKKNPDQELPDASLRPASWFRVPSTSYLLSVLAHCTLCTGVSLFFNSNVLKQFSRIFVSKKYNLLTRQFLDTVKLSPHNHHRHILYSHSDCAQGPSLPQPHCCLLGWSPRQGC